MASAYPQALDSSFPGYPYEDNEQYILAAYADAWVLAIQAIEDTLGAGSGSSALNPLYSVVFNETFSTITARIANAEYVAKSSQVVIDTSVGDVQPVGSTASAGNSGKASDGRHAHVGVHSVNGQTGDVTIAVQQITENIYNTTGQIVCGTGTGTGTLLEPQQDNCCLKCDSTAPCGVSWAAPGEISSCAGDLKCVSYCTLPTGWILANGQAVGRSTYPNLYAACTATVTGAPVTTSSKIVNGIPSQISPFLSAGMAVECPGYLSAGTTLTAVTTNTVTLSNYPIANGTPTLRFFLYGNGNGSTTFNIITIAPPGNGSQWLVKAD